MASRRLRPGPRVDPWTIGACFGQSSAKRTIVHSDIAVHFVEEIGEDIVGCGGEMWKDRARAARSIPLPPCAAPGEGLLRDARPLTGEALRAFSFGCIRSGGLSIDTELSSLRHRHSVATRSHNDSEGGNMTNDRTALLAIARRIAETENRVSQQQSVLRRTVWA